jgi:NitT/TauT family transport system ATP-binding protein
MANIKISKLKKSFPSSFDGQETRIEVLNNIDLSVESGELVTFFGPNGCGKTTLIHTIGGISEPDSGTIAIDGRDSKDARIGFVFQNYRDTLFPWLSNSENIGFPLSLEGVDKRQRARRIHEFLSRFNLTIDEQSYPYQQSGGQQQLIAILRALIYNPDLVLLDEPFAALDYTTRTFMQDTVLKLFTETKATALFISHEIDEAIYMADRLVLLSKRPARILRIIEVNLEKPRKREILKSEEFSTLRKLVVSSFQEALTE